MWQCSTPITTGEWCHWVIEKCLKWKPLAQSIRYPFKQHQLLFTTSIYLCTHQASRLTASVPVSEISSKKQIKKIWYYQRTLCLFVALGSLGCQVNLVTQSCLIFGDLMACSMQDFPVHPYSQSLLKLMSIESVMPSSHLILCYPLLLLPSIFPSIRVFSNESVLLIRWSKYWSFSFSISPSNEYSGLISIRIDWFDLLAVQGTLVSLLQHHSLVCKISPLMQQWYIYLLSQLKFVGVFLCKRQEIESPG